MSLEKPTVLPRKNWSPVVIGEVTPRGHTIRSIFAALDIDIEQWQKKTTVPKGSKKAAQWIFLAFLSGLLYFLLAFWEGFMDYQLTISKDADISPWEYTLVKLGILLFYSCFMLGFYQLGRLWENNWILPGFGSRNCSHTDRIGFHICCFGLAGFDLASCK